MRYTVTYYTQQQRLIMSDLDHRVLAMGGVFFYIVSYKNKHLNNVYRDGS